MGFSLISSFLYPNVKPYYTHLQGSTIENTQKSTITYEVIANVQDLHRTVA